MKAITLIILLVTFSAVDGLAQEKDIAGLLNNTETKSEIFNTILNDHQLMMDFMDAMKSNDHAMMMMRENAAMMGNQSMEGMHMNGEHKMMGMNNDNSEMMHQMMGMMKENPELIPEMMSNMMDMCEKDSTQCENMIEVMSKHPNMMRMSTQKIKDLDNNQKK